MAISQKKVFFQTLINEIDSTLPEMQFKGIIFIGETNFFPEFVLKGLATWDFGSKMELLIKKCESLKMNEFFYG